MLHSLVSLSYVEHCRRVGEGEYNTSETRSNELSDRGEEEYSEDDQDDEDIEEDKDVEDDQDVEEGQDIEDDEEER